MRFLCFFGQVHFTAPLHDLFLTEYFITKSIVFKLPSSLQGSFPHPILKQAKAIPDSILQETTNIAL